MKMVLIFSENKSRDFYSLNLRLRGCDFIADRRLKAAVFLAVKLSSVRVSEWC